MVNEAPFLSSNFVTEYILKEIPITGLVHSIFLTDCTLTLILEVNRLLGVVQSGPICFSHLSSVPTIVTS